MTSRTSLFLARSFVLALAACGGGGASSSQPTGPAPVVVSTPPPAAGDGTAAPAAPKITPEGVVFNHKLDIKDAKIYLAGSFNNWSPSDEVYLMKDEDGDGTWSITVKLNAGTYQYKYVINGKWTQDTYAPGDAPDGFGGRNSQFEVK